MDELQDEVLVAIEGLNVTVEFQEVRCHLVLQVIELKDLTHFLTDRVELPLGLHQLTCVFFP